MTPEKESLYRMTIEQYEAIRDGNLGCHRVELIRGVMHCRETGNLYRFQPDEYQALVERGYPGPDRGEPGQRLSGPFRGYQPAAPLKEVGDGDGRSGRGHPTMSPPAWPARRGPVPTSRPTGRASRRSLPRATGASWRDAIRKAPGGVIRLIEYNCAGAKSCSPTSVLRRRPAPPS